MKQSNTIKLIHQITIDPCDQFWRDHLPTTSLVGGKLLDLEDLSRDVPHEKT